MMNSPLDAASPLIGSQPNGKGQTCLPRLLLLLASSLLYVQAAAIQGDFLLLPPPSKAAEIRRLL